MANRSKHWRPYVTFWTTIRLTNITTLAATVKLTDWSAQLCAIKSSYLRTLQRPKLPAIWTAHWSAFE